MHLDEAGGTFLSRQREVEVQVGGGCFLVGRSFCLLTLTLTVAVLLCRILRTCIYVGDTCCRTKTAATIQIKRDRMPVLH